MANGAVDSRKDNHSSMASPAGNSQPNGANSSSNLRLLIPNNQNDGERTRGSLPRPPSALQQHVFPRGVSLIPPLPRLFAPGQQDPYVRGPVAQHMPQLAFMPANPYHFPPYFVPPQPVQPQPVPHIPAPPSADYFSPPLPPFSPAPPINRGSQPANPHHFPPYFVPPQPVQPQPVPPHIPAPPSADYFSPPLPPSSPAPPINRGSQPANSYHFPPYFVPPQPVQPQPVPPHIPAPPSADYFSPPLPPFSPAPPINRGSQPANPYHFPPQPVQPQPVPPHIPAPPSADYFSPPLPPSSPAPPINRGSQPANPYHFPPYFVPPQPVQPQPVPPHIPAPPSADYFSPPLPPSSPAPPINRARDSEYWGEKAREWVATQDSSDVSVNSCSDYDYRALLDCDDLVFPLEVPILPWMKMELARMDNIASRTTTEKKVEAVDVSVDVLSKILGLLERYNPDRSPHKYLVSPSKPVPTTPLLPPTSQAPSPSPSHLESARTADASDSSRSRHKRHCSTVESGKRSKRPKLGEG